MPGGKSFTHVCGPWSVSFFFLQKLLYSSSTSSSSSSSSSSRNHYLIISSFKLQLSSFKLQPATISIQPSTVNLQTSTVQLHPSPSHIAFNMQLLRWGVVITCWKWGLGGAGRCFPHRILKHRTGRQTP